MPDRTGTRRSTLGTVVALTVLLAVGGCAGGSSDSSHEASTSLDAEPVGAATLFPGSEQEEGPDIDIPQTTVGEPAARDVEIRNNSDEPMTVNDVSATGFEVSDDTCSGETVDPGDSCTFRLLGSSDGTATGSLTVETDQGSVSSSLSATSVEEDASPAPDETVPPTPTEPPSENDETEITPNETPQTPDDPDDTPDDTDDTPDDTEDFQTDSPAVP
jgi:hypothetical protein